MSAAVIVFHMLLFVMHPVNGLGIADLGPAGDRATCMAVKAKLALDVPEGTVLKSGAMVLALACSPEQATPA